MLLVAVILDVVTGRKYGKYKRWRWEAVMLYIGIDLGTSAVKLLLMDEEGHIKNEISREYPLEFPRPGWSQQNPED